MSMMRPEITVLFDAILDECENSEEVIQAAVSFMASCVGSVGNITDQPTVRISLNLVSPEAGALPFMLVATYNPEVGDKISAVYDDALGDNIRPFESNDESDMGDALRRLNEGKDDPS